MTQKGQFRVAFDNQIIQFGVSTNCCPGIGALKSSQPKPPNNDLPKPPQPVAFTGWVRGARLTDFDRALRSLARA
jgi:hypothetical protein